MLKEFIIEMVFKHLSEVERGEIEILWKQGHTQAFIAHTLHRARSTISREIIRSQEFQDFRLFSPKRRQHFYRYNAMIAAGSARERSQHIGRKPLITPELKFLIAKGYEHHWSPDEIIHGNPNIKICRNTIYNWILRGWIPKVSHNQIKHYHRRNRRRKEALEEANRQMIKSRSIDKRPKVINDRKRFGDWEIDCVLPSREGKKVIVTFNERLSRYTFMALAEGQSGEALMPVIDTFMALYGDTVRSITCDHGKEFANTITIMQIEQTYRKELYFAHAYSPEERGTNENSNGLIRTFLPKKHTFESKTQADMKRIAKELNTRPKKVLNWKTCAQVFATFRDQRS